VTHTTIQLTLLGMFATLIVAALLERRRSTDRIVRRRWLHVALAVGALAMTIVPWLFAITFDLSAVDWRVLSVSAAPFLLLFGFLLFAQGMLFDLSRDRICRRCGFDLRMREGLTCNECGRVAKSEAHLRAIRPSRTLQIAALLVCAGAFWMWRGVETREWGWRGAIPDFVLLTLWPWLPDAVVTGGRWSVPGTLAWRLGNVESMQPNDAIVKRVHRRLERATTIEEFARMLRLRNSTRYRTNALPLSASTIQRIVVAIDAADDRAAADVDMVSALLATKLHFGGIGSDAGEALRAKRDRLRAIADSAASEPTVRSRAAGRILLQVAREPGEIPLESLLDLLRSDDSIVRRGIARILALDPQLHAAVLDRAADPEDPDASMYHLNLLFSGGPFAAAPELNRRSVEMALARLAAARADDLDREAVAGSLQRMDDLPADLDAAVTLHLLNDGKRVGEGLRRLVERGPIPESLAVIERFRDEFERAVEAGMPAEWDLPQERWIDRDAVREYERLYAIWEPQRLRAWQSAAVLAWEAAHSDGRHDPGATLLEEHAEYLSTTEAHVHELFQHLQSLGAIEVTAPRSVDAETPVPD